jgi:hypothetical protein
MNKSTPNEKDNQGEWQEIKLDELEYQEHLASLDKDKFLRFTAAYNIGKLKGRSRPLAQIAATNLPDARWLISQMAEKDDKRFFVALGDCLKGRIKPYNADALDMSIMKLVWDKPSISDTALVYALKGRGFEITQGKRARDKIRSRLRHIRAVLPDGWKSKIPKRNKAARTGEIE